MTLKSSRKSVGKTSPIAKRTKTSSIAKRNSIAKKSPNKGIGRGGKTKGWRSASPKRGIEREEMVKRCPNYFLEPNPKNSRYPKYPICDSNCKPDCRGIVSAKVRSAQYHDKKIFNKAVRAEKKFYSPTKSPNRARRNSPTTH